MSRVEEVRGLYGNYQFLLVRAVSNAMESKRLASFNPELVEVYAEDLDTLWGLLPPRAQRELKARLREALGVEEGSFEDFEKRVDEECRAQRDEFTHPMVYRRRCAAVKKKALDSIFRIILGVMHRHRLFLSVRGVERGREVESGA